MGRLPRHLRDHDNIVKLLNVIPQEAPGPTSEIYLIFEYMPSDLSKFIRSGASLFSVSLPRFLILFLPHSVVSALHLPAQYAAHGPFVLCCR